MEIPKQRINIGSLPVPTGDDLVRYRIDSSMPDASMDDLKDCKRRRHEKIELFKSEYTQICTEILNLVESTNVAGDIDHGKIRIVWCGGRIQGKKFKYDSDIDLVITFERNSNKINQKRYNEEFLPKLKNIFEKYGLIQAKNEKPIFDQLNLASIYDHNSFVG